MHINITTSEVGNNRGSSRQLVSYLEKENRQNNELQEFWFNNAEFKIQPYEVRIKIDKNVSKLSKDEAKFFLINISPSENEINFLNNAFGQLEAKQQFKLYANKVMDEYARNFKKEYVKENSNVLYFGKLENHRYYTYKDEDVKQGLTKRGETKPGEQMHIQIIVSRKDISDSIRLSPLNNSRGANVLHSLKVGQFDRVAFKQKAEKEFDQLFNYDRDIKETFRYANILKNGSYEQKCNIEHELMMEQEFNKQEELRLNEQQQKDHDRYKNQGMKI